MKLHKVAIYFFPAIVDLILGSVLFITTVRFSESGANAVKVTAAMALWALVYSFASIVVGRMVKPRNAANMIRWSAFMLAAVSVCFAIFPGINSQYLWIALTGIGTALFFTPFQVFMKAVEQDESAGVVRSTAYYTCAWSFGIATGPFIVGLLWGTYFPEAGWKYCYIMDALLSLAVAFLIMPLKHYCERQAHHEVAKPVAAGSVDYSKMPDLAWLGWLAAGVGCVSVAILRTLFPYKSNLLDISKADQGYILALVSYVQGGVGLALCFSRYWMYKPAPVVMFSLSGIAGLILFGLGTSTPTFYLAAVLYGIYSGSFFFYLVFHSLVHPEHSAKYVSINEAVVGLTGILGPILGGYLVELTSPGIPFLAVSLLVGAVVIVQVIASRPASLGGLKRKL
ncbi:MAG: MFS transporter [Victivallaceae bacterium]